MDRASLTSAYTLIENPGGSLIPLNDTSSLGAVHEANTTTAKKHVDKFILVMRNCLMAQISIGYFKHALIFTQEFANDSKFLMIALFRANFAGILS